jgi:hypothetical protein
MKRELLKSKVEALKPGEEVQLSKCNGIRVTAERSGDGKSLRFVRHRANGFEVIKTHA